MMHPPREAMLISSPLLLGWNHTIPSSVRPTCSPSHRSTPEPSKRSTKQSHLLAVSFSTLLDQSVPPKRRAQPECPENFHRRSSTPPTTDHHDAKQNLSQSFSKRSGPTRDRTGVIGKDDSDVFKIQCDHHYTIQPRISRQNSGFGTIILLLCLTAKHHYTIQKS